MASSALIAVHCTWQIPTVHPRCAGCEMHHPLITGPIKWRATVHSARMANRGQTCPAIAVEKAWKYYNDQRSPFKAHFTLPCTVVGVFLTPPTIKYRFPPQKRNLKANSTQRSVRPGLAIKFQWKPANFLTHFHSTNEMYEKGDLWKGSSFFSDKKLPPFTASQTKAAPGENKSRDAATVTHLPHLSTGQMDMH